VHLRNGLQQKIYNQAMLTQVRHGLAEKDDFPALGRQKWLYLQRRIQRKPM